MSLQKVVLLAVGAYNPPTNMHLRLFELARDYLHRMGICKVIGGLISPVHDAYGKKDLLPAEKRLEMSRLAISTSDWLHVSDWEAFREGWTRTRVSLEHHQAILNCITSRGSRDATEPLLPSWAYAIHSTRSPLAPDSLDGAEPITVKLLCGADLLESFAVPELWLPEDIKTIVSQFGLVVVTRAGSNPERFIYDSDILTELQHHIHIVPEWISNEISSSKIRRALHRGESVKYLIPEPVLTYIQNNRLFVS